MLGVESDILQIREAFPGSLHMFIRQGRFGFLIKSSREARLNSLIFTPSLEVAESGRDGQAEGLPRSSRAPAEDQEPAPSTGTGRMPGNPDLGGEYLGHMHGFWTVCS